MTLLFMEEEKKTEIRLYILYKFTTTRKKRKRSIHDFSLSSLKREKGKKKRGATRKGE